MPGAVRLRRFKWNSRRVRDSHDGVKYCNGRRSIDQCILAEHLDDLGDGLVQRQSRRGNTRYCGFGQCQQLATEFNMRVFVDAAVYKLNIVFSTRVNTALTEQRDMTGRSIDAMVQRRHACSHEFDLGVAYRSEFPVEISQVRIR